MAAGAIRRLSPKIIGKIAAGEVVERPLSVVKELIENSLDAGATQISVEVGGGGIEFIRVTDDGRGIASDEIPLAFERHATSKLSDEADLERVATLGFRGEALPSIAAVARVEMLSRPPGAVAGGYVRLEEGTIIEQRSEGMSPGTVVVVRHLFRLQPARLKFLRSPAAEAAQIATVVGHYALAYPEVRFRLISDGRVSLLTPGSGRTRDAAAGVYGHRTAEEMLDLPVDTAGPASSEAVSVAGLVGPPSLSRASRGYVSIFINRRWVRSRSLSYAVEEAYRGMLPTGRFPVAIVDIRLPSGDVDVNVHPAKTEVRLRREREVFAAVQRCVRGVLSRHSPVPAVSASAWAGVWSGAAAGSVDVAKQRPLLSLTSAGEQRVMATPAGSEEAAPPSRTVPMLRFLGQVGTTYIVAEGPEGLYLVDQHAAHERVLFERILHGYDGPAEAGQALLEPVPLDLSPRQKAVLQAMAGPLEEQGFVVEPFGEGTYLVRAVPAVFSERHVPQSLSAFLDLLDREDSVTDQRERVAISLACHTAVRAGQALTSEEMRELLRRLEETQAPRTCPHGRPTMIHLSAEALAREFRRR